MEFLMTYGWAIVIMLTAIGILFYLGMFNPQGAVPKSCVLSPGFTCNDYRMNSSKLYLDIGYAMRDPATILSISCTAESGEPAQSTGVGITIKSGRHAEITGSGVQCYQDDGVTPWPAGLPFRGRIVFNYTFQDSEIMHQAEGALSYPATAPS